MFKGDSRTGKIYIPDQGQVSFELENAFNSDIIYLFAHGAGAGYQHEWMTNMSSKLVRKGVSVMRYNLPYMEKGGRPGSPDRAIEAISAVFEYVNSTLPNTIIFMGGKSYGGRMTSLASAKGLIKDIKGMVFFGFPLHKPGTPSIDRVEHFKTINHPMLFFQGGKDTFANSNYLVPLLEKVNADYYMEEDGDHSLKVPKRSGKNQDEVYEKLATKAADWMLSKK